MSLRLAHKRRTNVAMPRLLPAAPKKLFHGWSPRGPQGLVVIVRTAAKLGARLPAPLLRGWAAAALRRLPEFNPQDLANSLFSSERR